MSQIEILSPDQLKAAYGGPDGKGEYPAYNREEWREAVMHWATEEGYWTWVHNSLCDEVAEADAEEDMDVSQVSYADKGTCTPITEGLSSVPAVLRSRLFHIIAEQLGFDFSDISEGKSFVDDLGADSLDEIELVMAIEEEFSIEIPDSEAEDIKTVGQAIEVLVKRGWR
jgi:acyl carrier protein